MKKFSLANYQCYCDSFNEIVKEFPVDLEIVCNINDVYICFWTELVGN